MHELQRLDPVPAEQVDARSNPSKSGSIALGTKLLSRSTYRKDIRIPNKISIKNTSALTGALCAMIHYSTRSSNKFVRFSLSQLCRFTTVTANHSMQLKTTQVMNTNYATHATKEQTQQLNKQYS